MEDPPLSPRRLSRRQRRLLRAQRRAKEESNSPKNAETSGDLIAVTAEIAPLTAHNSLIVPPSSDLVKNVVVSSDIYEVPLSLTPSTSPELGYIASCDLSRKVVSIYEDGSSRTFPLFDTVRLSSLLHGERLDKRRPQSDYIFVDNYRPVSLTKMKMNSDARRSLTAVNAGGKSVLSEMLSMQYFSQVLSAEAILLEKEVEYWIDYKMVDYVCTVKGVRVGVSVTRAMSYPDPAKFSLQCARELLDKKLYGLIVSRNAVAAQHTFFKSVLHVWCQSPRIAVLVKRAYEELDITSYGLDVKGVVMLILTVCEENYIYTDRRPSEEQKYLEKMHRKKGPR